MIDLDLHMLTPGAPPIPDRDLWWDAVRRAAPEGDFVTRHRRGTTLAPNGAGHLWRAEAWVCCDPACGGVELGQHVLFINHGCCDPFRPGPGDRRHTVGLGRLGFTGYYHGPYTAWWEPS